MVYQCMCDAEKEEREKDKRQSKNTLNIHVFPSIIYEWLTYPVIYTPLVCHHC